MSGKKPVWVDEDAHAILKKYAKLTKNSMVEVASTLVLEKLSQLDPSSGLTTEAAEEKPVRTAGPIVTKPVAVNKKSNAKKRKTRRELPDPNAADVRFVGGIWMV